MEYINNYKEIKERTKYYNQLYEELDIIENLTFDEITIMNSNAKFLFVGKSSEDFFGLSEEDIVGKYADEIQDKGVYDKSITMEVIKKRKKVAMIQHTCSNKTLMVIGIPIFNKKNEITKIINISKDVTDIQEIKEKIKTRRNNLEDKIVTKNEKMEKIIELIDKTADLNATILISGETGVGKSFLAEVIHEKSNRKKSPFITINCGAIPENLIESELFGYEGGAFTGANKEGKKGLFEIAEDGTLFLDEIGEMPMQVQVKLLNVLQDKKAKRVGSLNSYEIKARVIAASNKDLEKAIEDKEFRKDLYYRLNVLKIDIPPLRDRKVDIPLLINSLLRKYNKKYNMRKKLSEDAYNLLISYNWPGNIRELENTLEKIIIMCNNELVSKKSVSKIISIDNNSRKYQFGIDGIMPIKKAKSKVEKQLLLNAKNKYKTTRKMAEVLKIDQSTVVRKMNKYNI